LAPAAGMLAVSELVDRLGVVSALDAGIGPIKTGSRGLSGGQLLVSLAGAQLLGQDVLAGLDRVRADRCGAVLLPVPTPPSTTAGSLARRLARGSWLGWRPACRWRRTCWPGTRTCAHAARTCCGGRCGGGLGDRGETEQRVLA
jgi:hypothetical protein